MIFDDQYRLQLDYLKDNIHVFKEGGLLEYYQTLK
jgi:hypothetical protein